MPEAADAENLTGDPFTPDQLRVAERRPGISAFMRIRNGADFLEATIRSHIRHFDEIVAVHNRCTDATPDILHRLRAEFGPRLRIYHYVPDVHPPGSAGHRTEPSDSPHSLVNYYNTALALTRFTVATKLDDDHLAIENRLSGVAAEVRAARCEPADMLCFSGINLARDESGQCGILGVEPFVGNGDHGFFRVTERTLFTHDPRFEVFSRAGMRRRFRDITYWHLKHMKTGFGFGHYEIEAGRNPRYERKRDSFLNDRSILTVDELKAKAPVAMDVLGRLPLPEKPALRVARGRRFRDSFAQADLDRVCAIFPDAGAGTGIQANPVEPARS